MNIIKRMKNVKIKFTVNPSNSYLESMEIVCNLTKIWKALILILILITKKYG